MTETVNNNNNNNQESERNPPFYENSDIVNVQPSDLINDSSIPRTHGTFDDSEFVIKTLSNPLTLQDDLSSKIKDLNLNVKNDIKSPSHVSVPIPMKRSSVDEQRSVSPNSRRGSITVKVDALRFNENNFVKEYPTLLLEDRFQKWKRILKSLSAYLREVSYAQEQFGRINNHLKNSVKFSFLTDISDDTNKIYDPLLKKKVSKIPQTVPLIEQQSGGPAKVSDVNPSETSLLDDKEIESINGSSFSGFMSFGSGSIQDIQVILKKYHASLAHQEFKVSKELLHKVVPGLEELRKELQIKCKEIKDLSGDFKSNLESQLVSTNALLAKYSSSVKNLSTAYTNKTAPNKDPFLIKLQLDLQIKHQLYEENYLKDAFINLQSSGLQLEKIVYTKIQQTLQYYSFLTDSEARLSIKNMCHELKQGILSQAPAAEWDHFVESHPLCLLPWKSCDPKPEYRKSSDVVYPQMKSSYAKCVRNGYLLKKNDSTNKYQKRYFLITSSYIHEFDNSHFFMNKDIQSSIKPNNVENFLPKTSLSLDDCKLARFSESEFVLETKTMYIQKETTSVSSVESTTSQSSQKSGSGITKLLKGSNHKPVKTAASVEVRRNSLTRINFEEPRYISFKIAENNPSEEDIEAFRKWISDIKRLTSYKNVNARAHYLDEKIAQLKLDPSRRHSSSPERNSSVTLTKAESPKSNLDQFSLKEVKSDEGRKMSVGAVDPLEPKHYRQVPLGNALPGNVTNLIDDLTEPKGDSNYTVLSNTAGSIIGKTVSERPGSPRYNSASSTESPKTHPVVKVSSHRRSTLESLGLMRSRSSSKGSDIPEHADEFNNDNDPSIKLTSSIYS